MTLKRKELRKSEFFRYDYIASLYFQYCKVKMSSQLRFKSHSISVNCDIGTALLYVYWYMPTAYSVTYLRINRASLCLTSETIGSGAFTILVCWLESLNKKLSYDTALNICLEKWYNLTKFINFLLNVYFWVNTIYLYTKYSTSTLFL